MPVDTGVRSTLLCSIDVFGGCPVEDRLSDGDKYLEELGGELMLSSWVAGWENPCRSGWPPFKDCDGSCAALGLVSRRGVGNGFRVGSSV